MFDKIENLEIKTISRGTSKSNYTTKPRKFNSLIIRISGSVRYSLEDSHFVLNAGDIAFLPKGSRLGISTVSELPSEFISINFEADLSDTTPFFYSLESFPNVEDFSDNLVNLWKFGDYADRYKCYSHFYNILSYLKNLESQRYIGKKKLDIISPAISYLKTHIYDSDLNLEKLYQVCNVSGTYFRKIFKDNYSVSPQQYILSKRLSHAKAIIDSGDYNAISEVALSAGYTDALYFSRIFKKMYGVSPSQYAKS